MPKQLEHTDLLNQEFKGEPFKTRRHIEYLRTKIRILEGSMDTDTETDRTDYDDLSDAELL